jgi:hypothetical protein
MNLVWSSAGAISISPEHGSKFCVDPDGDGIDRLLGGRGTEPRWSRCRSNMKQLILGIIGAMLISGSLAANDEKTLFARSQELLGKHQLGLATKMIMASDGGLKAVQVAISNTSDDRDVILTFDTDYRRTFYLQIWDQGNLLMRLLTPTHKNRKEYLSSITLAGGERHQWFVPVGPYLTDQTRDQLRKGVKTFLFMTINLSIGTEPMEPDGVAAGREFIPFHFFLREGILITLESENSPSDADVAMDAKMH